MKAFYSETTLSTSFLHFSSSVVIVITKTLSLKFVCLFINLYFSLLFTFLILSIHQLQLWITHIEIRINADVCWVNERKSNHNSLSAHWRSAKNRYSRNPSGIQVKMKVFLMCCTILAASVVNIGFYSYYNVCTSNGLLFSWQAVIPLKKNWKIWI